MNQITKSPSALSSLAEMHQAIDRMFESTWLDRESWLNNIVGTNWAPTVDIKEEKNQYLIKADIPGVDPKNIDVTLENGMLTIKGHKESETKEEREDYVHIERSQGSFCRSLNLPNVGDTSKVSAKTKNGVLEITIPKSKESSPNKIQIKQE